METGMVIPFAGSTPPSGYLVCDGASLLRSSYATLFGVIGTTFGSVDGTHFNVPDLRGRTAVGVGAGVGGGRSGTGAPVGTESPGSGYTEDGVLLPVRTLGDWFGGAEKYQLANEMFEHGHTITDPGHTHPINVANHSHTVTNPSHSHGVSDPGHSHNTPSTSNNTGVNTFRVARGTATNDGSMEVPGEAATGISINGATQNTSVAAASVSATADSAESSITSGWAGGNDPMDICNPAIVLNYIIKT